MFFVVLLLMYSSTVNANGSQCCAKAMGSCRSACEQLYLDAIADLETKQQRLLDVKNFCSSSLNQFWKCINETQTKGDSKTWKSCCNHAATDQCHSGCELAETSSELINHCRQSDEMYLFDCVEIKQEREECCGLARKPECHNMCRRWVMSPMQVSKSLLANTCNSPVINCLATLIPRVPLRQPHKYLHCCEHSNVPSCKDACRSSLKKQSGVDLDRLQENLDAAGCTAVSIHDKMWQCFLRNNQDPPIGNYEDPRPMHAVMRPTNENTSKKKPARIGVNDAMLHCCKKSYVPHCGKLCTKMFTTDFDWETFESTCSTIDEESMNQCLDEVTEPCSPGCKNLNFCTMFNNRPLDMFRNCHPDLDREAKMDYDLWVTEKKLILPNMAPIYVKNIEECSPITWKTVACALQLKPCNRATQSTRICRSSCYKLLNSCLDETRLTRGRETKKSKIAEVCSKLSSPDETGCVSLDPFLEAMGENITEHYTTPCNPDPCGPGKFCEVNHYCPKEEQGRRCDVSECKPGCPVGQVAAYLVPTDAFVPIPTVVTGKNNCYRICQCKTRIQECESLYCVPWDYCAIYPDSEIDISGTTEITDTSRRWYPGTSATSGGYPHLSYPPTIQPVRSLHHGSTLVIKCNLCVCFGGEITCSKRNCNETSQDLSEPSFFQLPCYCEPKHEPVCTSSGLTLMNECIAKCFDFKYVKGECNEINSCSLLGSDACQTCVEDHKVCLLKSDECPQFECLVSSGCQSAPEDPVCDEEGANHKNLCRMNEAGKRLAYKGRCLYNCKDSAVCGVDGNTYLSECHAIARFISVDYEGPCQGLGVINNKTGEVEGCPKDVVCHPLPDTGCAAFIPPGACCPICTGAIRILYSQKQIMRYQKALNTRGAALFTVEKVMKSLSRHIEVAECGLYGHLTMEMDLLVLIKSTVAEPTELQHQICALEAEKLAVLIERGSPRIVTDLSTSILVYAKVVHYEHQVPGLATSLLPVFVEIMAAFLFIHLVQ